MSEYDEVTGQQEPEDLKTPFTFKLMVVAVAAYLGWRLVEGVVWIFDQLF